MTFLGFVPTKKILFFVNVKLYLQIESRQMEYQMNKINFLIYLAWAEGGTDVGGAMLKIEKCCEGDRSAHASEVRK